MLLLLLLLIGLAAGVFIGATLFWQKGSDTSESNTVSEYSLAKKLSTKVITTILGIDNDVQYKRAREDLKSLMGDKLWREYFPTDSYKGTEKGYTVKVTRVTGTWEPSEDGSYVFRVQVHLQYSAVVVPVDFLITVEGANVTFIESLGVQGSNGG